MVHVIMFLLAVLLQLQVVVVVTDNLPSITFHGNFTWPEKSWEVKTTGWENVTMSMPNQELAIRGDHLFVERTLTIMCTAKYPIQWNIVGHTSHQALLQMNPVRRNLRAETFTISLTTKVYDFYEAYRVSASLKLTCSELEKSQRSRSLFVFAGDCLQVQGSGSLVNTKLLPCITCRPEEELTLHRNISKRNSVIVEKKTYMYKPTEGFHSNYGYWHGTFTCSSGQISVTVTAIDASRITDRESFQFSPDTQQLGVFSDSSVNLKCGAKNITTHGLRFKAAPYADVGTEDPPAISRVKSQGNLLLNETIEGGSVAATVSIQELIGGTVWTQKVSCVRSGQTNFALKNWTISFLATPKLDLENFMRQISCITPRLTGGEIKTVNCINSMDCNYKKVCLDDVSRCQGYVANSAIKSQCAYKQDSQKDEDSSSFVRCSTLPYLHLSGIVQCSIRQAHKEWEFFHSLSLIKYTSWIHVPKQELLRMDETAQILYTNNTSNFTCEAVSYLFADSLSFELEFDNGTMLLLDDKTRGVVFTIPQEKHPRKIYHLNFVEVLQIKLPKNAVGIHCIAPWGNSTDVMTTNRKFETRHLYMPQLTDSAPFETKTTFTIGQKNSRLVCPVKGEPMPTYEWRFDGNRVSQIFPELQTTVGSSGEGYLEFPKVNNANEARMYIGKYFCTGYNSVGSVTRNIDLNFEEDISSSAILLSTAIGLPLVVLVAAAIIVFILARRYRKSQMMLRDLTEAELEEFFSGRPELLENGTTFDMIEFLPYRNEYEICSDDLELKDLLGKGNFSSVFKGKIKSSTTHVAVKMVKSTADVDLFKTLLAEVKILMFIGEHENVVKLVGVCTAEIRNRSILIVTEICEMGSLDNILISYRPNFKNLINENQQIDVSLLDYSGNYANDTLSTLDLLNFATQVANGMTYLAAKSVIHADLACRNVLVTADRRVKVSDFGLSKKLYDSENYVKKSRTPLPWRWMAIESLTARSFSSKSDVWSYGVTFYEMFSLGDIPFPNEEWSQEFVSRLSTGMRMGRPDFCTPEIYSTMVSCWEKKPEQRPDFPSLYSFFHKLSTKYNDINFKTATKQNLTTSDKPNELSGSNEYQNA